MATILGIEGAYNNIFISWCKIFSFRGNTSAKYQVSNSTISSLNSNLIQASSGMFSNCEFNSSATTTGTTITLTGCKFINASGILTVNTNNCSIVGCQVGRDTGGQTATLTINAGANNTIVSATRTDTAITDNGTGSVLTGNVVY